MREAGFVGIVHEQIRQIRKSWCPNRKTRDTEANRHRRIVLAAVAEHPEWTFKRIGQEAGVGPRDAQAVIEAAGIKKPNTRFVTPEERRAREQFLIDARIEYFPHDIKFGITSFAYMKDRVFTYA